MIRWVNPEIIMYEISQIHLYEIFRIGKLMKTVAGGRENGVLLLNSYNFFVWGMKKFWK